MMMMAGGHHRTYSIDRSIDRSIDQDASGGFFFHNELTGASSANRADVETPALRGSGGGGGASSDSVPPFGRPPAIAAPEYDDGYHD